MLLMVIRHEVSALRQDSLGAITLRAPGAVLQHLQADRDRSPTRTARFIQCVAGADIYQRLSRWSFGLGRRDGAAPGVELLTAVMRHYQQITGRKLSVDRIMAWHVRAALGDALWRSEAGIPLRSG
jgi:hypothetical protein